MSSSRALLTATVLTGLAILGTGVTWTLFASLQPTEATIDSHRKEIDLSGLSAGNVMRVEWEGQLILIVHRTGEQIAWLENFEPPAPLGIVAGERTQAKFANRFRSLNKRYLVVAVRKNGDQLLFREITLFSPCDQFDYDSRPRSLTQGAELYGVLYCAQWYGHPIDDPFNSMLVYDIAGRNRNPWLAPLNIPPHYFKGETTLVLDPSA